MNIKSVFLAAAMTASVMMGSTYAQGCTGCAGTAGGDAYFGGPDRGSFGYASADCSSCGSARGGCSHCQRWREHWAHLKVENEKVCARNRAWPKPFDCADRQLYFSIWEPMLDAGYEKHCTLTQAHFDPETHELNKYGQSAVAGIMHNMPEHRKTIFIHRDVDQTVSDSRMNDVRNAIQTWYGESTTASIAFTDNLPTRSNGDRVQVINGLYREGTPAPVIPVATGGGGLGTGN